MEANVAKDALPARMGPDACVVQRRVGSCSDCRVTTEGSSDVVSDPVICTRRLAVSSGDSPETNGEARADVTTPRDTAQARAARCTMRRHADVNAPSRS